MQVSKNFNILVVLGVGLAFVGPWVTVYITNWNPNLWQWLYIIGCGVIMFLALLIKDRVENKLFDEFMEREYHNTLNFNKDLIVADVNIKTTDDGSIIITTTLVRNSFEQRKKYGRSAKVSAA